jgi:hypothetical protein
LIGDGDRARLWSMSGGKPGSASHRVRRLLLGVLTAVISINLWTGSPLLAVWLGSRLQHVASSPSMAAIGVTVVALVIQSVILVRLLAALNRSYDALLDREPQRWQAPWLKSMRAERTETAAEKRPLSTVERVAIVSVVAAVCAFEVWFFFFAGSSLPNA